MGIKRKRITVESAGVEGRLAGSGGASLDRRMPATTPRMLQGSRTGQQRRPTQGNRRYHYRCLN